MKLQLKYNQYIDLTSQQIEEQERNPVKVSAKSDSMDQIVADYKKLYSKESWYQEPKVSSGDKVELAFDSIETATDFFLEQSKQNRPFAIIDGQTNKVMAYSTGDGKMYHSDGREFKNGDKLSGGIDQDKFKIPEKVEEKLVSISL